MANTPVSGILPVKQKKLKRSCSEVDIDSDAEEDGVKSKYVKYSDELPDKIPPDPIQSSPLKKFVSDSTSATSPLADSGYEISVGNTPGSNKPWAYVQPGSSGYASGYISESDGGTPAVGKTTPGPLSPDVVLKRQKAIVPLSPSHLKSFLQKKFVLIKEEIDPSGIADILNTEGIISDKDVEMIREEKFRVEKCDILLKSIVRSTLKNDRYTPRKVISAFEKEGYGYLFKEFEKEKARPKQQTGQNLLTKIEIKGRFYCNISSLEDEIDPLLIIDDLVAEEVLSFDEHQDIKTTGFKPHKVQYLIEYVLRKSEKEFWAFCNVLEQHYQYLAEQLKRGPTLTDHRRTSMVDVTLVKKPTETYGKHSHIVDKVCMESTEVKFRFVGEGKDEEQMIVDDNSPDVDVDLQEEAMEIGFDIPQIQFSSILINLTSLSRQSQMEFLNMCRESPVFLEKWLQHLITEKHIQRLKEKNIDKMTFQIKLCLPDLEQKTKLSVTDFRRNLNFLVDELEPRHFREMLTGLEGSERIVEKVMSTEPRKERCRELLNFIIQKRNTDIFVQELERLNKIHIVEFLFSSRQDLEQVDLKEAIVNNYKRIIDEIEPRVFRQMFVERREIKAKEYDVICKMATRRTRAICFMRTILKRNGSAWKCFMDAIEVAGYRHLVRLIHNDIDTYKECPRLYQSLLGAHDTVNIEGEFQLHFKEGDVKESALQVFLHRTIYVSDSEEKENNPQIEKDVGMETPDASSKEAVAKRDRTRDWVQMQQMDRKRERNDFDDTEQPTESKQFRAEVALALDVPPYFSPASSPTFGMNRHGDLADYCSSSPLTRSFSIGSDERPPLYEDISPPSSPNREGIDKPHVIIKAPCSPLNICQSKRRNSLSDGSSHASSLPASPSNSRIMQAKVPRKEQALPLSNTSRSWSATLHASISDHIDTVLTALLKGHQE